MKEKKYPAAERRFNTKPILGGKARDLSKLPRWAADEIRRLESNLKAAEEKAAALSTPGSRIVVDPYSDNPIGLTDRSTVRFRYENSNGFVTVEGWIDVSIRNGVLDVNASDTLLVSPSASNHLALSLLNVTVDQENERRAETKRIQGIKKDPL